MPGLGAVVRDLVREHYNAGTLAPDDLGSGIASTLRWTRQPARVETVSLGRDELSVARGRLGDEPAIIFATRTQPGDAALVERAAVFAYHNTIQWGLVADYASVTVFNSHWLRAGDWYQIALPWEDEARVGKLLQALTPEGLTQGRIERLAQSVYEPEKLIKPVDDALVSRLDYWRDECLRYAPNASAADERLQTLFAQLFILRAIEDRGLSSDLPPLSGVLGALDAGDVEPLGRIISLARQNVQTDLFDSLAAADLPAHILAGVVRDLYKPSELGFRSFRYNFAWIDPDVLGRAYEKYLSARLLPLGPPTQTSLFDQPVRDVARISVRRANGVYYTPTFLTRFLAERCLRDFYESHEQSDIPSIVDTSCGSGSFLAAAADWLLRHLRIVDAHRDWGRELVDGRHLLGIDIDPRAVTLARLSLWLRLAAEPDPLPLPSLQRVIVQGDALDEGTWAGLPNAFDIALGNPPFLASGKVIGREEMAKQFETARGRFDYSYLFLELAVKKLKPDGALGCVVPNRFFGNSDAATIRSILTREGRVRSVVDFGTTEIFGGTRVYVGAIVLRRNGRAHTETSLRVVRVAAMPARFADALLSYADSRQDSYRNRYVHAYSAAQVSGAAPWLLLPPEAYVARSKLADRSFPLADIAEVAQGIRTGANEVFIVEVDGPSAGPTVQVRNGFGDTAVIEAELLHSVVLGAEIQRFDLVSPRRYILYPYVDGTVIAADSLAKLWPATWDYLRRYERLLRARESLSAGQRWYELIRKRDERWLRRPKLLVKDLSLVPSFAADVEGTTFLVGGTAVVPSAPELLVPLLAYLNSSLIEWYLSQSTPTFHDGFRKLEPRHLENLPVLRALADDEGFSDELERIAGEIVDARAAGDVPRQQDAEMVLNESLSQLLGIRLGDLLR